MVKTYLVYPFITDGHLDYFHLSVLLDIHLRVELLGYRIILCLTF